MIREGLEDMEEVLEQREIINWEASFHRGAMSRPEYQAKISWVSLPSLTAVCYSYWETFTQRKYFYLINSK